jgi:hypothetical protein
MQIQVGGPTRGSASRCNSDDRSGGAAVFLISDARKSSPASLGAEAWPFCNTALRHRVTPKQQGTVNFAGIRSPLQT